MTLPLEVDESGFAPMMNAVAPVSDLMTGGWEVVHKMLKEIIFLIIVNFENYVDGDENTRFNRITIDYQIENIDKCGMKIAEKS